MKRLHMEVTLLAIGLTVYFVGGFYIIHLMDVAVKELIMGMVK